MQIQPTFWLQMRRLCAQHLGSEDSLRPQIDDIFEQIPESSRGDRHQVVADLFTMLGRLPDAAELGFLIGGRLPLTAYGALSLGILTAPTVGDALRFVTDVHHLVASLIDCSYSEGRLTIGFRCPIDSDGEALAVAVCAATIDREIARYSGHSGNFARLELTPSSKGAIASYRKHLSLMPYTDGKSNTLVFERAVLDLPNAHADVDTFNSVMRACAERTDLQVDGASLPDRMREVIMSGIGAPPSQASLAKILDLTPRQLRTHLKWRRTSYQAIVRDCRTEYASALLMSPSLSLSQIADRLGYSDLPAFSHAFYRWTGKSPSAFRTETLSRCVGNVRSEGQTNTAGYAALSRRAA